MSNIVLPINEEEYQRDCQLMYNKGKADRDKEITEGNVFFSNKPIEDIVLEAMVDGYNQALDDFRKLANEHMVDSEAIGDFVLTDGSIDYIIDTLKR